MKYRKFVLFALVFVVWDKAFCGIGDLIGQVRDTCPTSTPLLIKKSVFELSHKISCDAKFTKQLLSDCKELDCDQLVQFYKKNIQGRSGSVVGE